MGDDNIEGGLLWAEEDLDGTAIYENPDIVDDGDEDDNTDNNSDDDEVAADQVVTNDLKKTVEERTLKRKLKFEKLKLMKKTKHEEVEDDGTAISSLSVEAMSELIMSCEPITSINASADDVKLNLTASNFFDTSKSLHAPAKSSCIFVNSIAASIPGFRKALNAQAKTNIENGSPLILVVCGSAHRSTDIINSMSNG
jgi:hypothetical protein